MLKAVVQAFKSVSYRCCFPSPTPGAAAAAAAGREGRRDGPVPAVLSVRGGGIVVAAGRGGEVEEETRRGRSATAGGYVGRGTGG